MSFISRDIDGITHDVVSVAGIFVGTNPPALSSLVLGGSPFTHINMNKRIEVLYVSGGTVSNVSIVRGAVINWSVGTFTGGTTTQVFSATGCTVLLMRGDILKVTYTVVPTIVSQQL